MTKLLPGIPTTESVDQQFEGNVELLQKSVAEAVRVQTARLQAKIEALEARERRSNIPPTFLGPVEPFVKSFDDHLEEVGIDYDRFMDMVSESLANASFEGRRPAKLGMMKSLSDRKKVDADKAPYQEKYDQLQKSWGNPEEYADLAKSILGDSGTPGAPGAWYHFLEENLSRYVQRIMLGNDDCTALKAIPTAITPNIIPEMARLKSYGVGYGKHTMGFAEGRTAQFGGSQLMDRLTHTLVQRGIRCSVTEMLLGNKQKLVNNNPLDMERELRTLEWNLGRNHMLLHGDSLINKDGSTVLEVDGFVKQIKNATTGYANHVLDWNGKVLNDTTNKPVDIFREVAEKLIINGHLQGGVVTGKYSVLMDYGVANQISTVVDDKQRLMIDKYEQAALMYGQSFSGVATDLGTFRFQRSKTLHLTANDTWTPDDDVSKHAIVWPAVTPTCVEAVIGSAPKAIPVGAYKYRISVVNDHGESNVCAAVTTLSIAATKTVLISIAYDAAFAGGVVNGYKVSPARYFLIYRGNAGETDDKSLKCIAKVPINGTSTTTYTDYNQKIPGCTDMFFIPNDPMDIAHTSLTAPFEIPLYDIEYGSTRQWMMMDIAGLCMWVPQRCFLVENVPGFVI